MDLDRGSIAAPALRHPSRSNYVKSPGVPARRCRIQMYAPAVALPDDKAGHVPGRGVGAVGNRLREPLASLRYRLLSGGQVIMIEAI